MRNLLIKTLITFTLIILFSNFGITVAYATDISEDFTDPIFKQAVWTWLGNPADSIPESFTKQDLINTMISVNYSVINYRASCFNHRCIQL